MVYFFIILLVCLICQLIYLVKSSHDLLDDKLWDWFIDDYKNMVFNYAIEFRKDKYAYHFNYGGYAVIVWFENDEYKSSIHLLEEPTDKNIDNCVLCSFNRQKSKKLAKLLLDSINFFDYKYLHNRFVE